MPMKPKDIAKTVKQSREDAVRVKKNAKQPIEMEGYAETSEVANNKTTEALQKISKKKDSKKIASTGRRKR